MGKEKRHIETMTNEIALQQNVFLVTKKFVTKSPVFRY